MERHHNSPRKIKRLRKPDTARPRSWLVPSTVKCQIVKSVLMGAIAGACACGIAGADTRGVVAVSECSVSLDIIDSGPYVVSVNTLEAPLFYPYTEEEVTMIAAIIQCEAGNQSDDGQRKNDCICGIAVGAEIRSIRDKDLVNDVIKGADQQAHYTGDGKLQQQLGDLFLPKHLDANRHIQIRQG